MCHRVDNMVHLSHAGAILGKKVEGWRILESSPWAGGKEGKREQPSVRREGPKVRSADPMMAPKWPPNTVRGCSLFPSFPPAQGELSKIRHRDTFWPKMAIPVINIYIPWSSPAFRLLNLLKSAWQRWEAMTVWFWCHFFRKSMFRIPRLKMGMQCFQIESTDCSVLSVPVCTKFH